MAIFLDVSFDKIWCEGLLYKVKNCSHPTYMLKSYLLHRTFRVKYGEVITQLKNFNSGVPLEFLKTVC